MKKLTSVLVKPAGPDCNMACTYCFYLKKAGLFPEEKTHRMSDRILEEMIRQVMTQAGSQVSFGWQGGEPTLMGVGFFRKAVEYQKRYGWNQSVGNGLQTNGLLIDRDWADLLCRYRFLVGLSIDGPEDVHDRYRKLRSGASSWKKSVDAAKRLLDSGVEVNALTVVNDHSVRFPEEIYEFHKSLGLIHMQFIPCVEADPLRSLQPAPFSVEAEDFGRFLIKLFDLWISDFRNGEPTTFIRFFDSLFYVYAGFQPPMCTQLEECGVYLVVEHNGDVYSCDFFVEPEWRLGNVLEDSLSALLNGAQQREFGGRKSDWSRSCSACPWLEYCRGGCPKDRVRFGNPETHPLCRSYRIFFDHAHERLVEMAEAWRRNNNRES